MTKAGATAVACVLIMLGSPVATKFAGGQGKPAENPSLDPRLRPLVGTWEGWVRLQTSREEQGRTLVIEEKAGQLVARYGTTGKKLSPTDLSVEVLDTRIRITFATSAANNAVLELVREDWLSGMLVITGKRGAGAAERPMEFQRKR